MAENEGDTIENAMDYSEHERTYAVFLSLSKWTTILCVALLIGMAFGFFGGGGFIGGTVVFIVATAVLGFINSLGIV